jgi:uncharacterized protein
MSVLEIVLLVLAGVGAGLTGSVAGLASLISYPALLGVGLSPVSANVTNTVALIFNAVGSVSGSRPELAGQAIRLRSLAMYAVVGGAAGALLLLLTPSSAFERIVPWLIGIASLAILIRRHPETSAGQKPSGIGFSVCVFLVAIYGGYFGAAAGVLLLALLLVSTGDTLPRCNAAKNLLLGLANGVAAVSFAAFGSVRWSVAAPLAAGLLLGGRLGPIVVRHVPATPLRYLIAAAGMGLALYLGAEAYHVTG